MSGKEKKFKVGLIRVLTCEDPEVLYSHQRQIMEKFPELEVALVYTSLSSAFSEAFLVFS